MKQSLPKIEHILDPSCPWYSMKRFGLPNVKWCEHQVCGWVEEPANAWSNLAYVLLGILLIRITRNFRSRALRFYGPAMVVVGFFSFTYHATNTYLLQIFDFIAMYIFCYLALLINLDRLGRHSFERSFIPYWALVGVTTGLTLVAHYTPFPIQGFILILFFAICLTEGMIRLRLGKTYTLGWFYVGVVCFVAAATFSYLDFSRLLCDPHNHLLQGHALWHVFSALGLTASLLHHRQFDELLANRPKA